MENDAKAGLEALICVELMSNGSLWERPFSRYPGSF